MTPHPPPRTLPRATQALGLLGWVALCYATAALGGLASINAPAFYAQLAQPSWSPPPTVFGPAWSILFTLMAISAWLVWRRHGWQGAGKALALFCAQLVVNALWSWLFFAWQMGLPALVDAVLMWLLIAATIVAFWRLHRIAAVLLLPYLAWVSFAIALNAVLWRMNPALLG
jgi:benzodiazapine receptor